MTAIQGDQVTTSRWLVIAAPLLYVAQAIFLLDARELWFSDEVRHAQVLRELLEGGHWLLLSLNDAPYPDKPPLYFLLQAALSPLTGGVNTTLAFASVALSGLAMLAVTMLGGHMLGDKTLGSGRAGWAGLCLLAMPCFTALAHYARMDMLFAALILASQLSLYRALTAPPADIFHRWALLGGLLAGLAALVKGPFGVVLPLAGALAYALWSGRLRRLLSLSFALALMLALALPSLWLLAVGAVHGFDFLAGMFDNQVVRRAVDAWHHREPWWYYLAALPVVLLPWAAAIRLPKLTGLWNGRHEASLPAYLWCCLASGLAVFSAVSTKTIIYLLPLLPLTALLAAHYLERFSAAAWKRAGAALGILGLASLCLGALEPDFLPATLRGLALSGLPLLAAGAAAIRWPGRFLPLGMAAGVCLWAALVAGIVAPSLDPVMSPKAQAERLGELAAADYVPVAFRVYHGIYAYHLGATYLETRDPQELAALLAKHPRVAIALRAKDVAKIQAVADGREVHRQVIAGQEFVILAVERD